MAEIYDSDPLMGSSYIFDLHISCDRAKVSSSHKPENPVSRITIVNLCQGWARFKVFAGTLRPNSCGCMRCLSVSTRSMAAKLVRKEDRFLEMSLAATPQGRNRSQEKDRPGGEGSSTRAHKEGMAVLCTATALMRGNSSAYRKEGSFPFAEDSIKVSIEEHMHHP